MQKFGRGKTCLAVLGGEKTRRTPIQHRPHLKPEDWGFVKMRIDDKDNEIIVAPKRNQTTI